MPIKRYNDFINEEEMTIDVNKWLLRGVLPAIIVYRLIQYGYSKHESEAKVKDAIEHYVDATDIFKKQIEYARKIVLDKVSKFHNDSINNKIKTIPIRIGETQKEANAHFIHNEDGLSCIVINKDRTAFLPPSILKHTIAHELFHYVDYLLGNWSTINEKTIQLIVDKDGLTEEVLIKRLSLLLLKKMPSEIRDKGTMDAIKELSEKVYDNLDYYTSNTEVYVRFNNLRRYMFENGLIKNINSDITRESLIKLVEKRDLYKEVDENQDVITLLMVMNFDLEAMNKIASVNKKTNNDQV